MTGTAIRKASKPSAGSSALTAGDWVGKLLTLKDLKFGRGNVCWEWRAGLHCVCFPVTGG